MRKIIVTILFFVSIQLAYSQHIPLYSQYIFNGLVLNPAFTGSRECLSITLDYRAQWISIEGAPNTFSFSAHAPLKNEKMGIGLTVQNDKIGVTNMSSIFPSYSYKLKLSENYNLRFGLNAALDLFSNRWGEVSTITENDPSFDGGNVNYYIPNVGSGLLLESEKLFMGISIPKFLSHKFSDTENRPKVYHSLSNYNYNFYVGSFINVNDDFTIKPSVLLRYVKGSDFQLDLTAILNYKNILEFGLGIRSQDAILGFINVPINDQFKFGYVYDYTMSNLNGFTYGSHEIILRYEFGYKIKAQSPRII